MKLSIAALYFFSLLLWVFPGELARAQVESDSNGSIEGMVILPSRNTAVRVGGGLYGRPSSPSKASALNDSLLIVLVSGEITTKPSSNGPVILDQRDQQFSPALLPVVQNRKVRIRNSDPVYHNVFSLSSTKKFDVGRRPRGAFLDIPFDKPGIVKVFCDIHSNMHAIIYVMPSNAVKWEKVAQSTPFQINEVPAGSYQLIIYAQGFEEYSIPIEVQQNEVLNLSTITLNS